MCESIAVNICSIFSFIVSSLFTSLVPLFTSFKPETSASSIAFINLIEASLFGDIPFFIVPLTLFTFVPLFFAFSSASSRVKIFSSFSIHNCASVRVKGIISGIAIIEWNQFERTKIACNVELHAIACKLQRKLHVATCKIYSIYFGKLIFIFFVKYCDWLKNSPKKKIRKFYNIYIRKHTVL